MSSAIRSQLPAIPQPPPYPPALSSLGSRKVSLIDRMLESEKSVLVAKLIVGVALATFVVALIPGVNVVGGIAIFSALITLSFVDTTIFALYNKVNTWLFPPEKPEKPSVPPPPVPLVRPLPRPNPPAAAPHPSKRRHSPLPEALASAIEVVLEEEVRTLPPRSPSPPALSQRPSVLSPPHLSECSESDDSDESKPDDDVATSLEPLPPPSATPSSLEPTSGPAAPPRSPPPPASRLANDFEEPKRFSATAPADVCRPDPRRPVYRGNEVLPIENNGRNMCYAISAMQMIQFNPRLKSRCDGDDQDLSAFFREYGQTRVGSRRNRVSQADRNVQQI